MTFILALLGLGIFWWAFCSRDKEDSEAIDQSFRD
jgi:nitrogen fixation-related uncharacterized protein